MRKVLLSVMLLTGFGWASPPVTSDTFDTRKEAPILVGRWRVVGCATSPRDPANCAKGTIEFGAKRWSVELACCKRARAYTVLSNERGRIKIVSEGTESEIWIDAEGTGYWDPGIGGRVGALSFVRDGAR